MNRLSNPKVLILVVLTLIFSLSCYILKPDTPEEEPEENKANTVQQTMTAVSAEMMAAPTRTPKPTSTPEPTITPDVVATQLYEDFYLTLQKFEEKGYVETIEGDIVEYAPFEEEWAQLGWYQWWDFDEEPIGDFLFSSHFSWSVAHSTPETSGCGIVFGFQENSDHYVVFLDQHRILFLMARGSSVYEVGKTRGSGRTNFANPAEADFALAVNGQKAYVSVDGDVTEYTLSMDQTSTGQLAITLLSGTNRDYGTRCEATDIMLWTPK